MKTLRALAIIAALLPGAVAAQVPQFPQTLPASTVVGRSAASAGPAQAIPFSVFYKNILNSLCQTNNAFPVYSTASASWVCSTAPSANTVFAGPTSGGAAQPTFRALIGTDLPLPTTSSLGGVQAINAVGSNWIRSINTSGVPQLSQPAFTDISGTVGASQLPNPSASTLGGVKSLAKVTHNWLDSIGTSGTPTQSQPACADVSDASVYCNATRGQLPGTTTNDNASSGNVGEYIESVVASASAVSLATNVAADVTTISLTAGDWDVSANVSFLLASTTSISAVAASVSTTLNTLDTTNGRQNTIAFSAFVPTAGTDFALPVQALRFSLSGTTTIHLVAFSTFTVNTNKAYGIIRARRVR